MTSRLRMRMNLQHTHQVSTVHSKELSECGLRIPQKFTTLHRIHDTTVVNTKYDRFNSTVFMPYLTNHKI